MPRFLVQEQQSITNPTLIQSTDIVDTRGAQQLGQAITQFGGVLQQHEENKNREWKAVAMARLKSWGAETLNEESKNAEPGAPDFTKNIDGLFDAQRQQILEQAPSNIKREMEAELEVYRETLRRSAMTVEASAGIELAVNNAVEIIELAQNTVVNNPEYLDQSIQDVSTYFELQPHLDAKTKAELQNSAKESIAKSALQGMDPDEALELLNSGELDSYLKPQDKVALINGKQKEQQTEELAEARQLQAAQAQQLSDMEIGISRGQLTYSDIENAYNSGQGWLSPNDRTRLTLKLDKQLQQSAETMEGINKVTTALNVGAPLDPGSKEDRKNLNTHFSMLLEQWQEQQLTPDEVLNRSVEYSAKTGIIPDAVQGMIRGSLRAGGAEQKALAAEMLQKIRNTNSELMKEFSEKDVSHGNLIATYVNYGATPSDAVKLATEVLNVDESTRTARNVEFNQLLKDDPNIAVKFLENQLDDGLFDLAPDIPPAMAANLNAFAQAEYMQHGNLEAAQISAYDRVMRVWGKTEINGKDTVMRFAPEKFYSVNGLSPEDNTKWMRDQLIQDVTTDALIPPKIAENIFITPIANRTDERGLPVYQVNILNEDGVIRPLRKSDGSIMAWQPSWERSKKRSEIDTEIEKGVAEAEAERLRNLGNAVR